MQDYMYSAVGLIAIVIQLIINFRVMFRPEQQTTKKAAKMYRMLMIAIFCYYITDALWGIFAGLNWIPALFVDTTIYYVAMSSAIVCFYSYIVDYLDMDGWIAKTFEIVGKGFFVLENVFLLINFFVPCFFWFDANDAYTAGPIRYAALWVQVALFAFSSIVTYIEATKNHGVERGRHLAIFFFSLTMLVAILFQEKYPLLPFYAIGCLIGSCILHEYVVGDEIEEYQNMLIAEKEKAEKASVAKTSFLARMSHDIRTPLNGIIGLIELSDRHDGDLDVLRENRAKEKVAAGHLLSLINDVLQMSKLEDGSTVLGREAVDLAEQLATIRTVIELRAVEMGIKTDFSGAEHALKNRYVYTSPLHFRQVLMNIFSNALKYNKPNGSVSAEVRCLSEDESKVSYEFVISDTGIGMSREFLEHIFDPFSQERIDARSVYHGTGLGMSIVKGLVDKMGGSLDVQSVVGEGSTFTVTLTFDIANKSDITTEKATVELDLSGRSLLLVEDNDLNGEIATEILEGTGAKVTWAHDGQQAVDLVRSKPAGSFDAVLMDLMMPVMNGLDATRAIRVIDDSDKAFIPIIAMTANAYEEDRRSALSAGMNGFVAKPISIPELMRELGRVMQ